MIKFRFVETESRAMVARGWGEEGRLAFNGRSISVSRDETRSEDGWW